MRGVVVAFFFSLLSAPLVVSGATLGNIDHDVSFEATASMAAMQNLGNGSFTNGEQVTGADIRIGGNGGNLLNIDLRSFLIDSNGAGSFSGPGYLNTTQGNNVYHFDFTTPFVPDPFKCYVLLFYQFFGSPATSTFYGWSTNQYTASTTGCHPQYASHDVNTGLQNPSLNGHGLVDYSFQIYTEPVQPPQSPPSIANLQQFRQFGVDDIAAGATFVGNAAVFKADISDADSALVKLEVELKPIDEPFNGASTVLSDLSSQGLIELAHDELIPKDNHYESGGNVESFHWRARGVDVEGNTSDWVEFGTDPGSRDFRAKVVPLYTQVESIFPSEEQTRAWAVAPYASGVDKDCAKNEPGFRATIAKCGCALTSSIMIAHYFGEGKDIDGATTTPLTANAWLKTHHGYTWDNRVDWLKLEQYFGTIVEEEVNARLTLDRNNFKTDDVGVVNSYLSQQVPVITFNKKYGHFIVLESQITNSSPTYVIRDPLWYNTKTLIDAKNIAQYVQSYQNKFASSTIFTKLDTPQPIVASVELFLASPAEILVTDPSGKKEGRDASGITYHEISGAQYYFDDPISSSEEEIDESQIHRVKVMMFPTLVDGTYNVQVIGTGSGSYTLTSSMTVTNGSTAVEIFTASTSPNAVTQYDLVVTGGEPQGTSPTTPPPPTIPELFTSLKNAIKNSSAKPLVKAALLVQVVAAEKTYQKNKIKETKLILTALEKEVALLKKKKQIANTDADKILAALAALKAQL